MPASAPSKGWLAQAAVSEQLDQIAGKLGASSPRWRRSCATPRPTSPPSRPSRPRTGRHIWSTNPLECVIKGVKRWADVVGIFPDEAAILRLVGAVLIEAHDEWAFVERDYLSEGSRALIPSAGDPAGLAPATSALLAS